ncbi:MAG TPA: hypothetical protein VF406_14960 [Thermodesulfobacteriota bacterium]
MRWWHGRIETVEADDAVLAGDDGARLHVPADWLPAGSEPGDAIDLQMRLRRRRPHPARGAVERHAPWLDTLSLVALAVGVAALVYHLLAG